MHRRRRRRFGDDARRAQPTRFEVQVLSTVPHDPDAFTEGLAFSADGRLFESTGLEGASQLREVDPTTGEVTRRVALGASEFGEGIAIDGSTVVQLTWRQGIAHRWGLDDFSPRGDMAFSGEGWGLTRLDGRFVQSDGTSTLTLRDDVFGPVGRIEVTRAGRPVDQLNELEAVDDKVYANVWHRDEIVRIDPASGVVDAVVDASTLWRGPGRGPEMTLNGIAHRPGDPADVVWLTGKNWPSMYRVRLVRSR
ncbi:MAG: glutaminyl-peptide cyclotransferase [Microthrixaceae bacterium]